MTGILTTAILFGSLRVQHAGGHRAESCEGQSWVELPVLLENQAGSPPDVVDGARQRMVLIFENIGVRVVWVEDSRQMPRPLIALIVPDGRAAALHIRDVEALGATLMTREPGGTVYVFSGRVDRAAAEHHVETSTVLGSALAHEVAHALLGRGAHTRSGVMQASWGPQEFQLMRSELLLFAEGEGEAIRKTLRRC